MTRQRRDELYPWLQNLTDEQVWKMWLAYDSALNAYHKGYAPYDDDNPITTHDQAVELVGSWIVGTPPEHMESLEDELELSEEYKLAGWVRQFRHKHESEEEERARYEHEDELAEELARKCQRRRPRN